MTKDSEPNGSKHYPNLVLYIFNYNSYSSLQKISAYLLILLPSRLGSQCDYILEMRPLLRNIVSKAQTYTSLI
jgi:hypothetical protein